jgi:uncharacterized protein with NRDE domain
MCLIAFAIDAAPGVPLLLAANRDEDWARPTAALHRWTLADGTAVIGGRDLREGGTWLGLSPSGRIAWLTNVRQSGIPSRGRSRGELVSRWLQAETDSAGFAESVDPAAYAGFNLVVGDLRRGDWAWIGNRRADAPHAAQTPERHWQRIGAGVHSLSNASLDTPWPKSRRLSGALSLALGQSEEHPAPLMAALTDTAPAADADLPQTGLPDDVERQLSSPYVLWPERAYGTRCSTLLRWRADGELSVDEWTHQSNAQTPALNAQAHRRERLRVA